ncbi:hypothetical protein VDGE_30452 [Verticillium dahliae]|uniref:Uncharacterized protein n=1 Tax=Verticillium dahliae TaxID=27337 RepID=A0A444RXU1_VERDA|nr:hypothetical protein VDGE_30452 [Verticillium dahliae]
MAPNVILLIQSGTRQLERLYLGELVQTSGHPIPYELRQRELEKTFRLRYEPSQGQIHEIRAEFAVRSDYAQAMHIFQCLGLRASVTRDASSPIHVLELEDETEYGVKQVISVSERGWVTWRNNHICCEQEKGSVRTTEAQQATKARVNGKTFAGYISEDWFRT